MGYLVVNLFQRKYRISDLIKLIFSSTKFLGSSIIEEIDGQWSVSPSLLAFNFFVSLVSSLALYIIFTKKVLSYNDSYLLQSLELFEYMLLFCWRILNLFSQVVNLEEIRQIMRSFKSLDQIFLNIDSKQSIFAGPPLYYFIVNKLLMTVGIFWDLFRVRFNLVNLSEIFLTAYLPYVMNVDVFCFCVLIYSVQVNLSYLSSCLEALKSKECKDGKLHDASIEYCCKAYNELCSQVVRVNKVYGLQLLVMFIDIFTVTVDLLYHLIYLKTSDQLGGNLLQVLYLSAGLVFTCFITFSITSACDRTVAKAKEFNTLLYQVMISDKTSVISKNKKMRLHASMKREIIFTAYGFFNLDYTLVHSIAAAATTYLVMLIQFTQPTRV